MDWQILDAWQKYIFLDFEKDKVMKYITFKANENTYTRSLTYKQCCWLEWQQIWSEIEKMKTKINAQQKQKEKDIKVDFRGDESR
jgi:hypothetical protein